MSAWSRLNNASTEIDDEDDGAVASGPPCLVCRNPVTCGQGPIHFECCNRGPNSPPGKVCNEIKVKREEVRRCAHCWAPAA